MSQLLTSMDEYFDPVKYKLEILSPDESLTKYTYDSFSLSNPPFALTELEVNLGQHNGTFTFKIDDSKDNVVQDTIDCGYIVNIYAAKKQSDYKRIMCGIIDDIQDDYPIGKKMTYTFAGLGFGTILNYTILNMIKSANKESIIAENTIVNDPTFRIDNLSLELFESTDVLPIKNSPTLKVRGGYLLDSIAGTINEFLPTVNSPLSTAASILENFASSSGNVLHIDPNRNVLLRPPYKVHSGITVRQCEMDPITGKPTRLFDPAENTSYYFGGWSSRKMMKPEQGFFNRIFLVINTDTIIKTAPGDQTANYLSLALRDIGQQFLPGSTKLFNITLLLEKVGTGRSSVEDALDITGIRGLICEDDGGNNPSDKVIATFTIPFDEIDNAPTPVYKIDLQYTVSSIDQNKKHWIILFKSGIDEDNTVRVYHDSDTTTESTDDMIRYSGTKKPFTNQINPSSQEFAEGWSTSSHGPVFRYTFFSTSRTTMEVSDPISIKKYTPNRPIEIRVNAPWINDMKTGFKYANALLQYGAKLKRVYEKKALSIPDKLFFPLQLVNIIYPPAGIEQNSNTLAEINNIKYHASAYDATNPFGSYFVELTAVGYVNHYQNRVRRSLVCTA